MGFHQVSDTHGKQGNLQQSNLLHWTETSVHAVSKGPNAATCQSTPASLPNNQSKKALHLGNRCYCEVSETSSACLVVLVSLNQETGGIGGLVSVDSTEDSSVSASSSVASPWPVTTPQRTPKSIVPIGTCCSTSRSSSSQFPTLVPLGADFGGPPLT